MSEVPPALVEAVRLTVQQPTLQVSTRSMTFPGQLLLYESLLRRPDAVARLWHAEGYTDTKVTRNADGWFSATDQAGSTGRWFYVYRGKTLTVAYGEGTAALAGGLPVPFRTVVLWHYLDGTVAGRPTITHWATAYFRLLNPNQHLILSTLRPVAEPIARRKLLEAMLSLSIPVRMAALRPKEFMHWTDRAGIRLMGFPEFSRSTHPLAGTQPAAQAVERNASP